MHTDGGLVKKLYRGYVRALPLGRDNTPSELTVRRLGIYPMDHIDVGSGPIVGGCLASFAFSYGSFRPVATYYGDKEFFSTFNPNSSTLHKCKLLNYAIFPRVQVPLAK